MLQQLTQENRLAAGLDTLAGGRRFAFLSVVGRKHSAALAVVIEGKRGVFPISEELAHADDLRAMQAHADRLNICAGIGRRDAASIMSSSFVELA